MLNIQCSNQVFENKEQLVNNRYWVLIQFYSLEIMLWDSLKYALTLTNCSEVTSLFFFSTRTEYFSSTTTTFIFLILVAWHSNAFHHSRLNSKSASNFFSHFIPFLHQKIWRLSNKKPRCSFESINIPDFKHTVVEIM